jgi:hypothetical protein
MEAVSSVLPSPVAPNVFTLKGEGVSVFARADSGRNAEEVPAAKSVWLNISRRVKSDNALAFFERDLGFAWALPFAFRSKGFPGEVIHAFKGKFNRLQA